MALSSPPRFDHLEHLARSRDADLLSHQLVSPSRNRGRGAQSNRAGRFETYQNEVFADGWAEVEQLPNFETVEHIERARTIISRNQSPDIPFDRSINPYRGCAHGCSYCYARPTHTYLGHSAGLDFESQIYVKVNAAEVLRRELSHGRYKVKPIAIGTNTDPYQPAERKHKIMRELLEVFVKTKHPLTITTKSALIVRDLDLLVELARNKLVSVIISITSMDHKLSRKMEPRASSPSRRLEAIRLLHEAGVPTSVLIAPIIPAINDSEIERLLDAAVAQGASAAGMILLRLPSEVKDIFREWLLRHFPNKVSHVLNLVRSTRGGKEYDSQFGKRMRGEGAYATILFQRFEKACIRYGISQKQPVLRTDLFEPPVQSNGQLSLF